MCEYYGPQDTSEDLELGPLSHAQGHAAKRGPSRDSGPGLSTLMPYTSVLRSLPLPLLCHTTGTCRAAPSPDPSPEGHSGISAPLCQEEGHAEGIGRSGLGGEDLFPRILGPHHSNSSVASTPVGGPETSCPSPRTIGTLEDFGNATKSLFLL